MANCRNGNGNHRRKSKTDKQRRGHCYGYAVTGHTLKKRSKYPSKDDNLYGFVSAKSFDTHADYFYGTGFIYNVIQKKSGPYYIKHIKREQGTFDLGIGQKHRVGPEK